MPITIERTALLAAMKAARVAVPTKAGIPILAHFRLTATPDGGLIVAANNLEIAVRATAPAVVAVPGVATVPAALAAAMLAQATAPTLTIARDQGRVRITGAGTKLTLPTLDPEDWPEPTGGEPTSTATCDAAALRRAIGAVAHATATDESRPILAGINLAVGGGRLVADAADGYRLARAIVPVGGDGEAWRAIVPGKALAAIVGVLPDGEVAISRLGHGAEIGIASATVQVRARTYDGAYPDFGQLLPREYAVVARVPRAALADAAKLAALAGEGARDTVPALALAIGSETIVVSGAGWSGDTEAEIAVPLPQSPEGEMRIGVNADYLDRALGAIEGEWATLRIGAGTVGMVILTPGGTPEGGSAAVGDATVVQGLMPCTLPGEVG